MGKNKLLNGWDVLILAIALVSAALTALLLYTPAGRQPSGYVKIAIRGEAAAVLPLNQDVDSYTIETAGGVNLVSIQSGAAYISYADCPDGLCVRQGAISKGGDLIVCLPHGVVIEITGLPSGIDGITR